MHHKYVHKVSIDRVGRDFSRYHSINVMRSVTCTGELEEDMGMRNPALLKFNTMNTVDEAASIGEHSLQSLQKECKFPLEHMHNHHWNVREILTGSKLRLNLWPIRIAGHRDKEC